MREETKLIRQQQIAQAAYEVLEGKGYVGASMLAIAKRAKASNETLYNWYGDKQGLFKALVARNAEEVKSLLEAELASDQDPIETLGRLGPKLLNLLTGARAVALNRAAAADPSGELGAAISEAGRETVMPLIADVLGAAKARGQVQFDDIGEAAELYLNLLIGDLQIRRVIGRAPIPTKEFCNTRSAKALESLQRLLSIG